jgi:Domain of unknown function (DUF4440)
MNRRALLPSAALFLFAALACLPAPVPKHHVSYHDSEQVIKALEQRWLDNETNPAVLSTILADDFVHVLPTGFISKADQLDWLKRHPQTPPADRHFEELRVRIYGSTAIANGIVVSRRPGAASPKKTIFTDVFVKRAGVWQAVNAQELPLRAR